MNSDIERKALFSKCRKYRYALWRRWDEKQKQLLFIGLNPSMANEFEDDPTIRRCIGFAHSWGYGGFCIANLYAFCHPYPKELFKAKDPVGPKNDFYLKQFIEENDQVALIWGNEANHSDRYKEVLKLIEQPFCLHVNKSGQPAHPLYLKKHLKLIPFLKPNQ